MTVHGLDRDVYRVAMAMIRHVGRHKPYPKVFDGYTVDKWASLAMVAIIAARKPEESDLLKAAMELLEDVRRRHPGEDLKCPHMQALDTAVKAP